MAVDPHVAKAITKQQIVGLDLIRGFAALWVVLFHLGFWAWQSPGLVWKPALGTMATTPFFQEGWVGVQIFFVISGFVIAYSAEAVTPMHFVRHRFKRLFPTALICATITCVFRTIVAYPFKQTGPEWLRSISFWPVGPWVDGTYWTLPVEIAFYLIVFVMLFWRRAKYLPFAMAALTTVSTGSCFLLLYAPVWVPFPVLSFLASCWFPPHACLLLIYGAFFALGVFLYLALLCGPTPLRGLGIAVSITGCVAEILWKEQGLIVPAQRHPHSAYPLTFWCLAMCLLIASVFCNEPIQRYAGEKGSALARMIGLTTYPLYLLHANIGEWLMQGLSHRIGYGYSMCLVIGLVSAAAAWIALIGEPWLRCRMPL